jgi:hypothetical protein
LSSLAVVVSEIITFCYACYLIELKKNQYYNIKDQEAKQAANNMTRMLIATSFLYVLGNTPYLIRQVILYASVWVLHQQIQVSSWLTYLAFACLYAYPGCKLFIYIYFNKLFRQEFKLKFFGVKQARETNNTTTTATRRS